jgi:hypothetical protein
MQSKRWIVATAILVLSAGAGWWFTRSVEPEVVGEKEDTGYTLEEREELMRTIGYVQQ